MSQITDRQIERAVELWCRALKRPSHNNGDRSVHGFMAEGLSAMVLEKQMEGITDYEARIEKFREVLVRNLKADRDKTAAEPDGYFSLHLGCDYHPDPVLWEAATEAGIPDKAFSYKSHVSAYAALSRSRSTDSPEHVTAAFGYAAPYVNHYPLANGDWLITTLSGADMANVIKAIESVPDIAAGILGLEVEHGPAPAGHMQKVAT